MPTFLPDATFDGLIADLSGTFITAAASTSTDLRDELVKALAAADVLPEVCAENYEGVMLRAVA